MHYQPPHEKTNMRGSKNIFQGGPTFLRFFLVN